MWLWYDWQAAAVADDEGIIHDQAIWDGFFDLGGGKRITLEERGLGLPFTIGHS